MNLSSDRSNLVPQLSAIWQPPQSYRILLFAAHDGGRLARLVSTPTPQVITSESRTIEYETCTSGIRNLGLHGDEPFG